MKTTVEISDSLLREARRVAAREGITLRTLIERALHCAIAEMKQPARFRLRRATFKGEGPRPEFRDASWQQLRDEVYNGRGT
jgi:hypothetical protein